MSVDYIVEDHVGLITLDNGKLNTITPAMYRQLHDILVDFLADPDVRCGVLRGAGERAFSAGDDIRVVLPQATTPQEDLLSELTPTHRREVGKESWEWARETYQMDRFKPIVGAIHGWCLGGGLATLLSLTDIRVASSDAKFGFPEIAYGMGGAGGMLQLTRLLPRTAAMSLVLTGQPIDAQEALRIHLVNEVVDRNELHPHAFAIARQIASHPPISVRLEMEASLSAETMNRTEALRYGERIYQLQRLARGESELESFEAARREKKV